MTKVSNPFLRENGELRKGGLAAVIGVIALFIGLIAGAIFYFLRKQRKDGEPAIQGPPPEGLTDEEAAARLDPENPQDNVISGQPPFTRKQIIRSTILTIFNLNLVLLGTIQFFFVRPLDGLITLSIIIVNVAVNVFQYEFAAFRLKKIQEEARPQVTVMRNGKPRSVDPREIVIGDIITAGTGDQIIADGPLAGDGSLLVDETMLGNGGGNVRKRSGDQLLAGSICMNGRAAYRADVLGEDRQVIKYIASLPWQGMQMTAIEKLLDRVMRVILVIMIILAAVFLLQALRLQFLGDMQVLVDPIIVILNMAPASLFFMVVLTYVSATADLARFGALVQQSRSVETLAQLDVICFAKKGFLTGIDVELQQLDSEEETSLPMPRIRQIMGDFAHSSAETNQAIRALSDNFDGSKRMVKEDWPFLSAYGWSALIFDDDDLEGFYVLAEPAVMGLAAAGEGEEEEEETENEEASGITSALSKPFAMFKRRRNKDNEEDSTGEEESEENLENDEITGQEPEKKGFFGRLTSSVQSTVGSVGSLISRDDEPEEAVPEIEEVEQDVTLIFAYNSDIAALDMSTGEWQLPENLTPLCRVLFEEKVKPEARDALNVFSERGVAVKIFSQDKPEETAVRLREAGVSLLEDPHLTAVDAPELEGMSTAELGETAAAHTVFGSLTPQKSADIVCAMRESGLSVGMAGDGVNDVAAMRSAELAIVRKDSSPAVLSLGDIVLLEEGQTTLSRVLEKGQSIVKGLVDILKLYITQIFYLLALIVSISFLAIGFPYTSQQASLIALITLTIPAVALSLWASTGKLPKASLNKILINFVAPASLSIAILGFLVYALTLVQYQDVSYAQNVLTYALVAMGLLLVVAIKPPIYIHFTRLPERGDIRPSIMVIISVIVFIIIARIPFFADIYGITPLQNPSDYFIILGASLIWIIVVNIFWRLFPLAAKVGDEVKGTLTGDSLIMTKLPRTSPNPHHDNT